MMCRPSTIQKLIHRFLMLNPVSVFLSKFLHHADSFMLRLTAGRHTFAGLVGLPIAQLTMVGAKTGKPRTITLVGIPADGRLVLLATNFGQKHNPAWYHNLKAHPECQVQWNGKAGRFVARETGGDEYKKYWQLGVAYYAGYEKYKERAGRRIPVMVLEPKE